MVTCCVYQVNCSATNYTGSHALLKQITAADQRYEPSLVSSAGICYGYLTKLKFTHMWLSTPTATLAPAHTQMARPPPLPQPAANGFCYCICDSAIYPSRIFCSRRTLVDESTELTRSHGNSNFSCVTDRECSCGESNSESPSPEL